MYLARLIIYTDRWSPDISTRADDSNTLTCQSTGTKNAPRDPPTWSLYTWGVFKRTVFIPIK